MGRTVTAIQRARHSRSPRVLSALASSGSVAVRLAVAGNAHTAHETLRLLVQDEVPAVRFTAGLHLLEQLVSSPEVLEVAEVLWAEGWSIPIHDGDMTMLAAVAEALTR